MSAVHLKVKLRLEAGSSRSSERQDSTGADTVESSCEHRAFTGRNHRRSSPRGSDRLEQTPADQRRCHNYLAGSSRRQIGLAHLSATLQRRLPLSLFYRSSMASCLPLMCLPRSCAAAVVAAASRSGLEAGPEMAASDLVHCRVACSHHAAHADLCVCSLLFRKGSYSIVSRQSLKRSECGSGQALKGSNAPATRRPQRCNECRGRRAACRRGVTTPPAVVMTAPQRTTCIWVPSPHVDIRLQEIFDYEADEPAADTAPVAETQQTDAPEADAAATAAADDAANADHAQVGPSVVHAVVLAL
jgi:hypothetical protein